MILEILPPDAWEKLQSDENVVLIDVRSTMEYQYVGHPIGAICVPWMEPPDWQEAPGFLQSVRQALRAIHPDVERVEDLPILSLCRSGQRSQAAGETLIADGFIEVYNVLEGFEGDRDGENHRNSINGWRLHGLPWEQS